MSEHKLGWRTSINVNHTAAGRTKPSWSVRAAQGLKANESGAFEVKLTTRQPSRLSKESNYL